MEVIIEVIGELLSLAATSGESKGGCLILTTILLIVGGIVLYFTL